MLWRSHTRKFPEHEIKFLEETPAKALANAIAGSDPLVALRCLAEIMLNGDAEKLMSLLQDRKVAKRWASWQSDQEWTYNDKMYARWLTDCPQAVCNRRISPIQARQPKLPVLHLPREAIHGNIRGFETQIYSPQALTVGSRIIIRCDELQRPYFESDMYFESGTVTYCDTIHGRHYARFKSDPYPPTMQISYDSYHAISNQSASEIEGLMNESAKLRVGHIIVLKHYTDLMRGTAEYRWGEVTGITTLDATRVKARVHPLPKPF